jgi:hypothetical protein
MTEITSTVQIVLQEAGYATWLVPTEQHTAVCFEDDALMGFACIFDEPSRLLQGWRSVEATLLTRYAPWFREAEDKAWNVYSIFLCAKLGTDVETREIRRIDEDLERTRKRSFTSDCRGMSVVSPIAPEFLHCSDSTKSANSGLGIVLATDTIWRVLTAPYGLSSPR